MRNFDKKTDSMMREEYLAYKDACKLVCEKCLGEEGDCIPCVARISFYTVRSENRAWEWEHLKENSKNGG